REHAARWTGPCMVVLAAVAIASEAPFSWFAGGASLGLLVGEGLRLFRRQPGGSNMQARHRSASSTILLPAGQTAGAIVFLLVLALSKCLLSAPPDSQPPANVGRARVVFPVDDNQQPAGDYVYLE